MPDRRRDSRIAAAVVSWFKTAMRPLPWRTTPRDPWRSLVSELMAQQTQISRVAERFEPFMDAFPTPQAMRDAGEDAVLAQWSGLGYYRRARLLYAAASAIADDHNGHVPADADALRALPGIGRYTAGAIASIVFDQREPIVDGNVRRVLMRLDADDAMTERATWDRATNLVEVTDDPAALNEGLMELGATVCTPRNPTCAACPLKRSCRAVREGRQEEIPAPKKAAARRTLFCTTVLSVSDGAVLIRQRPATGLWASMWEAPTLERDDRFPSDDEVEAWSGLRPAAAVEERVHQTTHREVRFRVVAAQGGATSIGEYRSLAEVKGLALSSIQRDFLLETAPGLTDS